MGGCKNPHKIEMKSVRSARFEAFLRLQRGGYFLLNSKGGNHVSKKASEHHKKASEHLTHAARHHEEAAKHHGAGGHDLNIMLT